MTIQVDSREKARAITKILAEFERQQVKHYISKLYIGDYMSLDNPRVIVDRKQNLSELCGNVCQQHERFRNELIRAQENGIKLIILCENGKGIETLNDLVFWENPRSKRRVKKNGVWTSVETKAMKGDVLMKILTTLECKYGCKFIFCSKEQTGRKIIEILGEGYEN